MKDIIELIIVPFLIFTSVLVAVAAFSHFAIHG